MQKSLICADDGEMLSLGWATDIQEPEGFLLLRKKWMEFCSKIVSTFLSLENFGVREQRVLIEYSQFKTILQTSSCSEATSYRTYKMH